MLDEIPTPPNLASKAVSVPPVWKISPWNVDTPVTFKLRIVISSTNKSSAILSLLEIVRCKTVSIESSSHNLLDIIESFELLNITDVNMFMFNTGKIKVANTKKSGDNTRAFNVLKSTLTNSEISKNIDAEVLLLFWQFTIKTLEELDIVSNQNLSIEMFLMRLMHINFIKPKNESEKKYDLTKSIEKKKVISDLKTDSIDQIKNITQEKKNKPEIQTNIKSDKKININSLSELIEICNDRKEIKLKYELEKNINLVSFDQNRIEISFNDNLDKNFVKDLSLKLFEWTNERWLITFSKSKGEISIKEKEKKEKINFIKQEKESNLYKIVLETFRDANLIDIAQKNKKE
mgnify:CR=1 FL=1